MNENILQLVTMKYEYFDIETFDFPQKVKTVL